MNVKKYIFATAASVLMIASLNAADYSVKNSDGQYISIYTGINEIQNIEFATDVPIYNGLLTVSGNIKNDWDFDVGYTVGGRIGGPIFSKETFPLLGKITGEIEGSISKADINSIDISETATITAFGSAADISLGGGAYPVDGEVEYVDLYLNTYYIAEVIASHFAPFWGFGIGVTSTLTDIKTIGYSDAQLSVFDQSKEADAGVQFILGADLVNVGDVSAGLRFIRREIWKNESKNNPEVLNAQFHLKYNF